MVAVRLPAPAHSSSATRTGGGSCSSTRTSTATTAPASGRATRRAGPGSSRSSSSRAASKVILAGDVGGTKTVLAVLEPPASGSSRMTVVREVELPSHEIDTLEGAVEAFLLGAPRITVRAACLGVAGPVVDGRCVTTNLPWEVHERRLAAAAHAPTRLLNDLEATAHGILVLPPEQFLTLQAGVPKPGANMALIAAGTGLGQALLIAEGQDYRVVASEGGHADFAPPGGVDVGLLRFLTSA